MVYMNILKFKGSCANKLDATHWQDWKWQIKNSIIDIAGFEEALGIRFDSKERAKLQATLEKFPLSITPYYLSLIDSKDFRNDPIYKQAFPSPQELVISNYDMLDPLAEDKDSPVPGITHRYPDRVLLHVSNTCAMYCRHCTRKRKVGDKDSIPKKDTIFQGINYIKNNPNIRDVLLSGGDPFMLSDNYLDTILNELSKIKHIEVIRIGTRIPVVLPYRITDALVNILKKYQPLWINTHFNHPNEVTPAAKEALEKLADVGIPLGNQSVLLAGINDCPLIMKKLVHKLVQNRVRPYYLYQCDLSEGLSHFRTPVGKGIEIIESLRGHTSGFSVPTYVIDAPGGGGKIPVMPNYLLSWSGNKVILRNFEGVITTYQEPASYKEHTCDEKCTGANRHLTDSKNSRVIGISKLLSNFDKTLSLVPDNMERTKRRSQFNTNSPLFP